MKTSRIAPNVGCAPSLGFCIEKKFVQPMLNFLGAITTKHALSGLMQKNDCCEINAKEKEVNGQTLLY
jgi:hypothetical protein